MTKQEIKFLEDLLERPDVKGKARLRQVIWLNTVQPKFKEGDIIQFSERSSYCYGNKVINFIGTVENVFKWYDGGKNSEKKICYGIRYDIEVDGQIEAGLYANTEESKCSLYTGKDTINHVIKKGKNQQSMSL